MNELGAKLNAEFNSYLQKYMETFLPEFKREIGRIFRRYQRELSDSRLNNANNHSTLEQETEAHHDSEDVELREDLGLTKDLGGIKSFFEWFFRGQGPKGLLSGAAFQRNRISSDSSVFSTLFDENFVADLLDVVPSMVLDALSERLGVSQEECGILARNKAYCFLVEHTEHRDRPPRRLVFECYQAAALGLLADSKWRYRDRAAIILKERFSTSFSHNILETPSGFPSAHEYLTTQTIFTKLREYPHLMSQLWPLDKSNDLDFRGHFRRREQRRELFSAIARLGAASIDLYLLAIKQIGSFQLGTPSNDANIAVRVAHDYIERLDSLSNTPGFNAFYELSQAANTFDNLVAVNFPRINDQELPRLTVYFGNILGQQAPVAEMSGQVNKRPVAQFRMPGFPLVMISTDVLQEGEDLHTFCRRVIHYGIAWTPSALEQRTGRVDRIGGLVQRKLDGSNTLPREEELIQVYYPHLQDTVELLQVRRVLKRLNKFMELIHEEFTDIPIQDSSLDTDRAVHDELQLTPQYKEQLKSAFDVKKHWLKGSKKAKDVQELDWKISFEHFRELINRFVDEFSVVSELETTKHSFEGHLLFDDCFSEQITIPKILKGKRHEFVVRLRSHVAGEETLIQCESPIVEIDIGNRRAFSDLKSVIDSAKHVKICLKERVTKDLDRVFIRDELLFNRFSTKYEDLLYLVGNVIPIAATLRTKWDKISDSKR